MNKRKGIILAGGNGTRLMPLTYAVSKQLLPIYNKPMIYYSLSVLMLAGIKEILLITQSKFIPFYRELLGNGHKLGLSISYQDQNTPAGIAEAFIIGESFIEDNPVALILGDNIFYGANFSKLLIKANQSKKANLFSTKVSKPSQFGVVKYKDDQPIEIIEKPNFFISHDAITGLYFYNNDVIQKAKSLSKSDRGELEITDLNNIYLKNDNVIVNRLPRGTLWLDTGTFENIHQCSQIIYSIEHNTNIMIGCIEEIALMQKWIDIKDFKNLISTYPENEYSSYLKKL